MRPDKLSCASKLFPTGTKAQEPAIPDPGTARRLTAIESFLVRMTGEAAAKCIDETKVKKNIRLNIAKVYRAQDGPLHRRLDRIEERLDEVAADSAASRTADCARSG